MAGTEPDGSLRNARQHDGTMNGLFGVDGITTFDEVYDSFDEMGLQENLLRGIYACGNLPSVLTIRSNFYCYGTNLFHYLPDCDSAKGNRALL
ncbi:eukaryotic translation initiation factor 4A1 [Hibiscus trionum]|uniref:Eukaryotic translation initiation factor 4A1 n=1 Tax=Hibiscus trionum TaxID=183268 RepID=A0A9W7J314_HIBTR|nr:eukaryotic translation initiation factor 4A1 [Hibiscus trionum]